MSTERTKGKGRTRLVTSGELRVADTERAERERRRGRDGKGRFDKNNKCATERGAQRDIKGLLGCSAPKQLDTTHAEIVKGAHRLFKSYLRSVPSHSSVVRSLLASAAWHTSAAGYWRAVALSVGLSKPEGIKADERATVHDVRGERLFVSAVDLAARLPKPAEPVPAWWVAPAPATPAQREPATPTRQDASQGADEGEDVSDDLDEPLARLRACRGPHGACDLDEDDEEGES